MRSMQPMRSTIRAFPGVLARLPQLDRVADPLSNAVEKLLQPGAAKDALSGTWLGHPAHPMLTDVTVGSWTSAVLLDALGGPRSERAADRLVGLGLLAAVPTAVTGLSDWADTTGTTRRVGLVHGMGNSAALLAFTGSWMARKAGARGVGAALGLLGMGIATATAYLGGHLVYERGVGVSQTTFDHPPSSWTAVADETELREGKALSVLAGDAAVLLVRSDGGIRAIGGRCSHRGAPLHKGSIEGGTVTCPWHGSRFELSTGEVVRGPATASQPAYQTRTRKGKIEVRPVPQT